RYGVGGMRVLDALERHIAPQLFIHGDMDLAKPATGVEPLQCKPAKALSRKERHHSSVGEFGPRLERGIRLYGTRFAAGGCWSRRGRLWLQFGHEAPRGQWAIRNNRGVVHRVGQALASER